MAARPWLGALGVRGRIVGAVLVTSAATLGVAAVALLGPLQRSLRNAELTTLQGEVGKAKSTAPKTIARTIAPFEKINLTLEAQAGMKLIGEHSSGGVPIKSSGKPGAQCGDAGDASAQVVCLQKQGETIRNQIITEKKKLQALTGATEVALFGYPDVSRRNSEVVVSPDSETARNDPRDDVARAFHNNGRPVYSFGNIGHTQYVRAALPFTTAGPDAAQWVLVVRKPLDEVSSVVAAVRNAFFVAALVALVLALLFGITLSAKAGDRAGGPSAPLG